MNLSLLYYERIKSIHFQDEVKLMPLTRMTTHML